MELTWVLKIRLAAAAILGVIIIGFLAWPLAAPPDPFGLVSLTAGQFTIPTILILACLSFICGVLGFFASWPYGKEIGIFAVPAGLAVWAIRTGPLASFIQSNPGLEQRLQFYGRLKWESFFWLALVLLGFAAVHICQKVFKPPKKPLPHLTQQETKLHIALRVAIALAVSIVIGKACISIFVQDVPFLDPYLGTFVGRPVIGQVVFGIFVAFLIVGFIVRKFIGLGYIWPIIATAFITFYAVYASLSEDVLERLVERLPANVFSDAALAVLPIQIVAFGTIGAVTGYWAALRYQYWREHELE